VIPLLFFYLNSVPFDIRTSAASRKRRDENSKMSVNASDMSPIQPERITMIRAIEVFLPENLSENLTLPSGKTFNHLTNQGF
jgi:hypothetical protein